MRHARRWPAETAAAVRYCRAPPVAGGAAGRCPACPASRRPRNRRRIERLAQGPDRFTGGGRCNHEHAWRDHAGCCQCARIGYGRRRYPCEPPFFAAGAREQRQQQGHFALAVTVRQQLGHVAGWPASARQFGIECGVAGRQARTGRCQSFIGQPDIPALAQVGQSSQFRRHGHCGSGPP